jgi:hypothetical protein
MKKDYITLGYHCNITYLTQAVGMKNESGLFEWLESRKLSYITDVINIIKINIDTDIIKGVDNRVHIINTYLYTGHYKLEEYKDIFIRRANRFLDMIKSSSEIIFIRLNPYNKESTTIEEINDFCRAIQFINPILNIKFLLIDTIKTDADIIQLDKAQLIPGVFLLQKYFYQDDIKDEWHVNSEKINDMFYNYMQEIGYKNVQ